VESADRHFKLQADLGPGFGGILQIEEPVPAEDAPGRPRC
jgi:hypothetical protein